MLTSEDLHEYSKLFDQALGRLERSILTKDEKKIVREFCDEKIANGISKARAITYINNFIWIRKLLTVPLTNATKSDLIKLLKEIESSDFADITELRRPEGRGVRTRLA